MTSTKLMSPLRKTNSNNVITSSNATASSGKNWLLLVLNNNKIAEDAQNNTHWKLSDQIIEN